MKVWLLFLVFTLVNCSAETEELYHVYPAVNKNSYLRAVAPPGAEWDVFRTKPEMARLNTTDERFLWKLIPNPTGGITLRNKKAACCLSGFMWYREVFGLACDLCGALDFFKVDLDDPSDNRYFFVGKSWPEGCAMGYNPSTDTAVYQYFDQRDKNQEWVVEKVKESRPLNFSKNQ